MNPRLAQNLRRTEHVLTDMDPIRETHLSEPGLLVIDVVGLDDATVLPFHAAIARIWATTPPSPPPGMPDSQVCGCGCMPTCARYPTKASHRSGRAGAPSEAGSVATGESDGASLRPPCHTRPHRARYPRDSPEPRRARAGGCHAECSSRSWGPLLRTLLTAVETGRACRWLSNAPTPGSCTPAATHATTNGSSSTPNL
jgi:hypothetical protein